MTHSNILPGTVEAIRFLIPKLTEWPFRKQQSFDQDFADSILLAGFQEIKRFILKKKLLSSP